MRIGPVPFVDTRLVAAAHDRGLAVHVWTVNDAADMRTVLDLGVDGVMTDRADVLARHPRGPGRMADAVIEDQAGFGTRTQRRGWYIYGWASHVFPTLVTTVFMSRYLTSVAENAVGKHGRLHILGIPIAPGSLFVYVVTAATVLLIGLMPLVGAIADRTGAKRAIMLGCGWAGATCCVLDVLRPRRQLAARRCAVRGRVHLLQLRRSSCTTRCWSTSPRSADRDRLSSVGWGVSYLGGGILLAVAFVASLALDKSTLARTCAGRVRALVGGVQRAGRGATWPGCRGAPRRWRTGRSWRPGSGSSAAPSATCATSRSRWRSWARS